VAAARWEGLLYGVTGAISVGFLAVIALLAGLQALDGDLSIGELVAVVGLAQFVAEPMGMLAYLVAQVATSRASARRIVEFLASPPQIVVGDREANGVPALAVDGATSGPLTGVSFTAGPGRFVAVMSEQPADAAALMTLLRGETAPDAGAVTLADVPLTELRIDHAHARLLVADHHVDLFEGSLRSNLDPTGVLDADQVAAVLEASAAVDIVTTSEHGLDEPVAVNGTTLSGGQRQRLGLARALAADPPVLVLHDPTTAVDAVTEQRIADGLHGLRHADGLRRTTLVITSSPALLARADLVVHLRHGRVVAHGRHEDLVADPGYREAVLR
jgi:putative ABC transport system ATP-binding protein